MASQPAARTLAEQGASILEAAEREQVKFMRLQFTDILGTIKNVEIPDRQFQDAFDGRSCSTARPSRASSASKNRTCTCVRT